MVFYGVLLSLFRDNSTKITLIIIPGLDFSVFVYFVPLLAPKRQKKAGLIGTEHINIENI